jgi:cell division protein FtsI (penicillin-binding protein 3)
MMEGVVQHGTATNLKNNNYSVAGKTGTALVADGKMGYAKQIYRSSFVGYFPADRPKYTCMVMVNGPSKGIYYGALVAGPVFKELADKVYATSINMHKEMNDHPLKDSMLLPDMPLTAATDILSIYNGLGISAHGNKDTLSYNSEWSMISKEKRSIRIQNKTVSKELVPNLKGMGLKDALYLLEQCGLKVYVSGYGKVKEQSLTPGQRVIKGMSINLKLG